MYLQYKLTSRFSTIDKLDSQEIILGLQLQMCNAWKLITEVFNGYVQKWP